MRRKDWADNEAERLFYEFVAEEEEAETVIDEIAKSLRKAAKDLHAERVTGPVGDHPESVEMDFGEGLSQFIIRHKECAKSVAEVVGSLVGTAAAEHVFAGHDREGFLKICSHGFDEMKKCSVIAMIETSKERKKQ